MAEKLMMYYQFINDIDGLAGKVKLASYTKIPSTKAALEPDTKENVEQFRHAIEAITGKAPPVF